VNAPEGGAKSEDDAVSKINPFLWFDGQAEAAANFYVSVFPNSRIKTIARYPENAPGAAGSVMTVEFELDGLPYVALNGGPNFKFSEAVSFVINCKDQAEIDRYWDTLTADGGEPGPCGWLKDKFGLSWQVVPDVPGLFDDPGAFHAMLKMTKLDIAKLQAAKAA
jgi:predicted 3-demethylubiquinone-9 3-methyltransferase (glyoxalase superfamily)